MDENNMQNEKTMDEKIKDFKPEDDLKLFFENFIKTGNVVKEKEVVKGMVVKLKVLDTGETLTAESILSLTNPNIPPDIIQKVRAAAILSQSIISMNGLEIEKEDLPQITNKARRDMLYSNLLKMPGFVVQKIYELYLEAYREQNTLYSKEGDLGAKLKNF